MIDWTLLIIVFAVLIAGIVMLVIWLQGHDARWQARYARALAMRENDLVGMIADSVGLFRDGIDESYPPQVVIGESALSTRYYSNLLPDTRSKYRILKADHYAHICQLARREAVIRMLESARDKGCNAVCNVQIDSTDMGHTLNRAQRAMVMVTATGTAYRVV